MSRPMKLAERIDMLLADAGGSMSFADLAVALWPSRESHRYSSNGGPPGCYMALSAGLRRGGFSTGGSVGAGNRIVYSRKKP